MTVWKEFRPRMRQHTRAKMRVGLSTDNITPIGPRVAHLSAQCKDWQTIPDILPLKKGDQAPMTKDHSNAHRLAKALYDRNPDDLTVARLSLLLDYDPGQLRRDIISLTSYMEELENACGSCTFEWGSPED